jgi:hypothetical protein
VTYLSWDTDPKSLKRGFLDAVDVLNMKLYEHLITQINPNATPHLDTSRDSFDFETYHHNEILFISYPFLPRHL